MYLLTDSQSHESFGKIYSDLRFTNKRPFCFCYYCYYFTGEFLTTRALCLSHTAVSYPCYIRSDCLVASFRVYIAAVIPKHRYAFINLHASSRNVVGGALVFAVVTSDLMIDMTILSIISVRTVAPPGSDTVAAPNAYMCTSVCF
jgi:hypothetical protein